MAAGALARLALRQAQVTLLLNSARLSKGVSLSLSKADARAAAVRMMSLDIIPFV